MIKSSSIYWFCFLFCVMQVNSVYGNSSSPYINEPNSTQNNLSANAQASGDIITFSEFSLGTHISNQYSNYGIIFGGDDPYIESDGAQPQTPVLSGSPQFIGAIEGYFVNPENGETPATVTGFSFDAGYFNAIGSTRLEWFDFEGNKLGEKYNTITGIETLAVQGVGISSWRIGMTTTDDAGFTIDNFQITGDINVVGLEKDDDVEDGDCRGPLDSIVYTITWNNTTTETIEDVTLVDYLPIGVDYDTEIFVIQASDPNEIEDPNFIFDPNMLFDPNYVWPEPEVSSVSAAVYNPLNHTVAWQLGDLTAGISGSVSFRVIVNQKSEPGIPLHNIAKLFSNSILIATKTKDTPVCCRGGNIIYVDKNANGLNNGTNWTDSYTDLQIALDRAKNSTCEDVNTIYIADGEYKAGDSIDDSFVISEGISVYGGFAGNETSIEQRDINNNPTILTGYIDPNNKSISVVKMEGDRTLLDGVTIQDAGTLTEVGQGLMCNGTSSTVSNCIIKNNVGYGIYSTNSNVVLKWCSVNKNSQDGIYHSGTSKTIIMENCTINDNIKNGIRTSTSTPTITNSVICRNGSEDVSYYGIRISNPSSNPDIYNNTITYNYNEGIYFSSSQNKYPNIFNCIVWYNNNYGGQLTGYGTTHYSCIYDPNNDPEGTSTSLYGDHNFTHKPDFAYPYSTDPNICINVHLASNSFCKDKGSQTLSYTNQYDIDNEDRVSNNIADVGADEISCDNVYNAYDYDKDGIVNYNEFIKFSENWLAHDPNDPALHDPNYPMYGPYNDPNSPYYISPKQKEKWYSIAYKYNLSTVGVGIYSIDVADLMAYIEDAPWLWTACWRHDIENYLEQAVNDINMMSLSLSQQTAENSETVSASSVSMLSEFKTDQSDEIATTSEAVDVFDPISEYEQLLSLMEDIEVFIEAGGEDAQAWQEIKILLEQSLVDIEDMTNEPNEI